MKHLLFYTLRDDILGLLERVEIRGMLKYTRTGHFPISSANNALDIFDTGTSIPNLGRASAASAVGCESFLVTEPDAPIIFRNLKGRSIDRISIDQLLNPDSVTFTPGGLWNEDVVLHGRVATASESQISQLLMRRFQEAIRQMFTKVRAFYVGPMALKLLEAGKRLTSAVQSPPEFDLAAGSADPD
jgi:hypothetical protein